MSAWVIGLHLLSLHNPACYDDYGRCVSYNKETTGIYARAPNGFTYGGYTNSYGYPSAYAGWTFETPGKRFALTVAAVTGYPEKPLRLMALPSVKIGLTDKISLRIAGGPKVEKGGASLLHLAIESTW